MFDLLIEIIGNSYRSNAIGDWDWEWICNNIGQVIRCRAVGDVYVTTNGHIIDRSCAIKLIVHKNVIDQIIKMETSINKMIEDLAVDDGFLVDKIDVVVPSNRYKGTFPTVTINVR